MPCEYCKAFTGPGCEGVKPFSVGDQFIDMKGREYRKPKLQIIKIEKDGHWVVAEPVELVGRRVKIFCFPNLPLLDAMGHLKWVRRTK